MHFTEHPRVIYKSNPLDEVITQARFSRILRLEEETPAEFQERIKDKYPVLIQKESVSMDVFADEEVAKKTITPIYEFSSREGDWTLVLSSEFLALTTKNYTQWEEFIGRFEEALGFFIEIYNPNFYSRLGLRYKDLIVPSKLGLKDRPWSDLINPVCLGFISDNDVGIENIRESLLRTLVTLDNGFVTINCSLVKLKDSNETCYLIDSDFFTPNAVELGDARNILGSFNSEARNLFRWCIKEDLHNAMEPEPI